MSPAPRTSSAVSRSIPSRNQFLAGVAKYDGNNHVYFQALRGVQGGWGDPEKMAEAICPLLCDWHKEFYRYGSLDPAVLASAIKEKFVLLNRFRGRTIDTLSGEDEAGVRELFWKFQKATGRTNKRRSDGSPVGAAKALHLLCPHFLSLWDEPIAERYGFSERDAYEYVKFNQFMKEFAAAVQSYLNHPDDRSILKRIDEYNYSVTHLRKT